MNSPSWEQIKRSYRWHVLSFVMCHHWTNISDDTAALWWNNRKDRGQLTEHDSWKLLQKTIHKYTTIVTWEQNKQVSHLFVVGNVGFSWSVVKHLEGIHINSLKTKKKRKIFNTSNYLANYCTQSTWCEQQSVIHNPSFICNKNDNRRLLISTTWQVHF